MIIRQSAMQVSTQADGPVAQRCTATVAVADTATVSVVVQTDADSLAIADSQTVCMDSAVNVDHAYEPTGNTSRTDTGDNAPTVAEAGDEDHTDDDDAQPSAIIGNRFDLLATLGSGGHELSSLSAAREVCFLPLVASLLLLPIHMNACLVAAQQCAYASARRVIHASMSPRALPQLYGVR